MKNREDEINETMIFEALEAIYYDTLTPIAQKMRDAGIDLLQVNWQSDVQSYWEPCDSYAEMTTKR
ncbi:MAG: hypothetical protein AAGA80_24420 [Cyanobacteria bacterium P01_F01_bin.143]